MATPFGMDDPFVLEQQRAQAALQKAQEQQQYRAPQGPGMVGRVYVGSSPLQHVAELLRVYKGGQQAKEAESKLADIGTRRNQAMAGTMSAYIDALRGKDAVETPKEMFVADDAGGGEMTMGTQVTPAVAPNPMRANEILMKSQLPQFQQMGYTNMMAMQQKQAEQAQAQAERQRMTDLWKQSGGDANRFVEMGGDINTAKSLAELPTIGKPKVNMASDMLIPDPANPGGWIPNQALIDAKKGIAKAGAVNVDARSYNTQENEQSKTYGKTLGEIRGKITQAGFDAPKQLAKLDRMEQLLQGVDGGAAAPTIAQVSSLANSFGIKLDKNLGPKEAAIALAVNMASGLREPGTGPMTDKDFDNFLKQVPDLSKSAAGRQAIMTTLRASIQRDLEAAKFARSYAQQNKGVIDDNFFDAMAEFYAKTPVVNIPMPETNSRGGQFRVVR